MKIFCLGLSGRPISEKLSEVLFYNAHDMIESGDEEVFVQGRDYSGAIRTDFKRASLVFISGIMFEATIVTPKGETYTKYIVRDQDLEGIEHVQFGQGRLRYIDSIEEEEELPNDDE